MDAPTPHFGSSGKLAASHEIIPGVEGGDDLTIKLAGHYCYEILLELLLAPEQSVVLLNISPKQLKPFAENFLFSPEDNSLFRRALINSVREISRVKDPPAFPLKKNKWFYIPEIKTCLSPGLLARFLSTDEKPRRFRIGVFSAGISELWQVILAWVILESSKDMQVSVGCDVGVNAIQTTREALELVQHQDAIICTAGMEAILPEVVAAHAGGASILAVPSDVSSGIQQGVVSFWSISNISVPGLAIFNINSVASACRTVRKIYSLKLQFTTSDYHPNSLVVLSRGNKDDDQFNRFLQLHADKPYIVVKTAKSTDVLTHEGYQFKKKRLPGGIDLHMHSATTQMESDLAIRIVYGGFADEQIAHEILAYLALLVKGDIQIVPYQPIFELMHSPDPLLSQGEVLVVVAGSSGTYPNLISGMYPNKLTVAVPVSEPSMISMVNGCVFGVPVVGCKSPALNAVTFVLSVLSPLVSKRGTRENLIYDF